MAPTDKYGNDFSFSFAAFSGVRQRKRKFDVKCETTDKRREWWMNDAVSWPLILIKWFSSRFLNWCSANYFPKAIARLRSQNMQMTSKAARTDKVHRFRLLGLVMQGLLWIIPMMNRLTQSWSRSSDRHSSRSISSRESLTPFARRLIQNPISGM